MSLKAKNSALEKRKVTIVLVLIAIALIIYGIGICTDFFASPMFSAFFFLSRDTARAIGVFAVVAGAAITVCFFVIRRRDKIGFRRPSAKQSVAVANLEKLSGPEQKAAKLSTKRPQENKLPVQTALPPQSTLNEPLATSSNGEKITCPNCQKEFTTPMLMMDYSGKEPKLARYCPYCNSKV